MAARAIWKGVVRFADVELPVKLYSAVEDLKVHFRLLDGAADAAAPARVEQRMVEPGSGDVVPRDEVERGLEVEPGVFVVLAPEELEMAEQLVSALAGGFEPEAGEFVVVEDEELEGFAPGRSREIDLRRFVPAEAIHPLYFERPYFLTPAAESNKAYRLLARAMERTGRAGIATFVMRGKEYLVAILSEGGILRAETLRFQDEMRTPRALGLPGKPELDRHTLRRIEKAVEGLVADRLDRSELEDAYTRRVEEYAREKRERGVGVVETAGAGEAG